MVAAADLGGRKESAGNLAPKSIPLLAEEGAKREPDRAKPQEKTGKTVSAELPVFS